MSKFHVNQIASRIRELYAETYWDDSKSEVANLSQLLALHGVHITLDDASSSDRMVEIVDGGGDRGIDAIAVDRDTATVVLSQAKWRIDGKGSMSLEGTLKFVDGARSLLGMQAQSLANASDEIRQAVLDTLSTPGAKIRLITITTASEPLSEEVLLPINDLLDAVNDIDVGDAEAIAQHHHIDQAQLFASIAKRKSSSVTLEFQIQDWGKINEPHRMIYGRVSASEISQWYIDHRNQLFAENIRVVIPSSDINNGIAATIRDSPEEFLYFNNGIVILAEGMETGPSGALNREVAHLRLTGASVVNGAQTVSTLGRAREGGHEEELSRGFVLVRCIAVDSLDDALGRSVTRFANTQNVVTTQDFAFLDPEQHRLAAELSTLGFEYLLRSGEFSKSDESSNAIDVRQAAIALACASSNPAHSIVAKREISRLFADQSTYKNLFNPLTDPLRLVRATRIVESVDTTLDNHSWETEGLESGIATHARRTVSHLILRKIGDSNLANPEYDFEDFRENVPQYAITLVEQLMDEFPANSYPGNVFKNSQRVTELVDGIDGL